MGVIRHKIWHDVWEQKSRTIQVVLIIAIGAFAIGTIMGAAQLIRADMSRNWQAVNPPMIGFYVDPTVDDEMLNTLEGFPEVSQVDGWIQEGIQWRRSPDEPWQVTGLIARDDYTDQTINTIALDSGTWPHRKLMGVERGHDFKAGDHLYLKIDDKVYEIELSGVMYNALEAPASFGGNPTLYTTRERFTALTGTEGYRTVVAHTTAPYSFDSATEVADLMQSHLEKQSIDVYPGLVEDDRVTDPKDHFIQEEVDTVFFILGVLATMALVLGLFLVYNTITAVISQQVNQIGMMKAIGADFWQILFIYFGQVLVYAGLALLVAIPLGAFGAHQLRLILIGMFNMEPGPFQFLPQVVLTQMAIALLSPLVVTVVPIIVGARLTVREAINNYGLQGTTGILEALLQKVRFIPHSIALTIGNTFRNKGRVFVTQLTLIGSGLVFMMVMHTNASLVQTYSDDIFAIYDFNVWLSFESNERISAIETVAAMHPEVKHVEMLGFAEGTMRLKDQPKTNDDRKVGVGGLQVPTQIYRPKMRGGRWLQPDDTYALVLNQELAEKVGVTVGDWVTLDMPHRGESHWQVVGLFFEPFDESAVYGPQEVVLKEARNVGKASVAWVQTIHEDAESEARIAQELHTLFEANGYGLNARDWDTSHQLTENVLNGGISIVTNLLAAMAVLTAIVGGVALSGVLSINVLERRREIGVMRAVGAMSAHIFKLVIGEGLLLGWLSWLLATPLSLPGGVIMTAGVSSIMGGELSYGYSVMGMVYWLGIITVLAIIASTLPAWKATRISVRESLAYQ